MKIIDAAAELNEPVNVDQLALHTNGDSTLISMYQEPLSLFNSDLDRAYNQSSSRDEHLQGAGAW